MHWHALKIYPNNLIVHMDDRGKILFILIFAGFYSMIQLTPTLAGYAVKNDKIYLGFESTTDAYFYAAFVNDAKTNFLLENRHTSEPQLRRYFLPMFNVMGIMANWMDIAAVFLIDRFLETVFFLLCLWHFLGLFFANWRERFSAYVFIPLAGGIGW